MSLKEEVRKLVEKEIEDSPYFLIDVEGGEDTGKILVLLDGREGIGIDDCVRISRAVSEVIDEDESGKPFRLEISSPGVDRPLVDIRQYHQHIGRTLQMDLSEKQMKGKLLEVHDRSVVVEERLPSKQKHIKDKPGETMEIPFGEIVRSKVIVSFN